jgi:hypothetical protein
MFSKAFPTTAHPSSSSGTDVESYSILFPAYDGNENHLTGNLVEHTGVPFRKEAYSTMLQTSGIQPGVREDILGGT